MNEFLRVVILLKEEVCLTLATGGDAGLVIGLLGEPGLDALPCVAGLSAALPLLCRELIRRVRGRALMNCLLFGEAHSSLLASSNEPRLGLLTPSKGVLPLVLTPSEGVLAINTLISRII